MSAFEEFRKDAYPYRFAGTLSVSVIAGGTPSDPNVAEAWLKTKLGAKDKDDLIREEVVKVMAARGISVEDATKEVNTNKHLNGFKRDANGLYIEGRQLKAAIKEATSVAYSVGKLMNKQGKNSWGLTSKGIHGFVAEHVVVPERRLYLGITADEFATEAAKPSGRAGVMQRFVSTFRGTGIQYEEYVNDARIDFTVWSDYAFTPANWAAIWLTGEQQGIGASRSQGFGTYEVTKWEPIKG